jgi:hypothetical protein
MAYIGQSPSVGEFRKLDDISSQFNDSNTSFALQVAGANVLPGSAQSLLISIDGVLQEPGVAYTLNDSSIVFTAAPNTSSTFFGVQLGTIGQVGTPSDATVTTSKLTANAVTEAKIANDAVGTRQIQTDAVTSAEIINGAVTGDKLDIDAVTTTKILNDSVTSLKLAPNIVLRGSTTFLGASLEEANVISSNVAANVVVDNQIDSIVYYTENSTSNADVTVNFNNMDYISTGNVASYVVILTNNADYQAYVGNVQINGASGNTVRWQGGVPTEGDANINVYSFSVIKTAASGYTVLAAKNNFD